MTRIGALLALMLLAGAASLPAQQPAPVAIDTFRLENGLRVVVAGRRPGGTVAVSLWYHVGSRHEAPGRTGLAHLFEHLMFQGSDSVGPGEHQRLIEAHGGSSNGTTTEERTNYVQVLPASALPLALWLEADRMRSLRLSDSLLRAERQVVHEERRVRLDMQPFARAIVEGSTLAYDSTRCFGYAHTVLGSAADLDAATLEDLRAFRATYYAPGNATLAVVGDVDPAEVRALATRYFGALPAGAAPPPAECTQPFGTGIVGRVLRQQEAGLAATLHAYRVPGAADDDLPALELLAIMLGQGPTSRLQRELVRRDRLALSVQVGLAPGGTRIGPNLLTVFAIGARGTGIDSLDRAIEARIDRLRREPPAESELFRVRRMALGQIITSRQYALSLAEELQEAWAFMGSPDAVNRRAARIEAVTPADIQRVASRYLVPANMLVVRVVGGGG